MMSGVDLDVELDVLVGSTPKRVPASSPEPEGRGGRAVSLARGGLGDGAVEGGPVEAPVPFLVEAVGVSLEGTDGAGAGALFPLSMSMVMGSCRREEDSRG